MACHHYVKNTVGKRV